MERIQYGKRNYLDRFYCKLGKIWQKRGKVNRNGKKDSRVVSDFYTLFSLNNPRHAWVFDAYPCRNSFAEKTIFHSVINPYSTVFCTF